MSHDETAPPTPETTPDSTRRRELVVVRSPDKEAIGRGFELGAVKEWVIGRDAPGTGKIEDPSISRSHFRCSVQGRAEELEVADLGTRYGTLVNGQKISEPILLSTGDVIRAGDTLFVLDEEPNPYDLLAVPTADGQLAHDFVGISLAAQRMRKSIVTIARAAGPVLLSGETGTGKEVSAREIHRLGRGGPLAVANSAAIPESLAESELFGVEKGGFTGAVPRKGLFREGDGGTVFLDEIEELSLDIQAKLLRTLQDGSIQPIGVEGTSVRVDTRVILATNRELDQVRRDFMMRIRWKIRLTPLRERKADVLYLLDHFLRMACKDRPPPSRSIGFDEALLLYDWPGNVRELLEVAETLSYLVEGGRLDVSTLPRDIRLHNEEKNRSAVPSPADGPARPPREVIEAAIDKAGKNMTRAAQLLGIGRTTLYRWMGELGIPLPNRRS